MWSRTCPDQASIARRTSSPNQAEHGRLERIFPHDSDFLVYVGRRCPGKA